MIQRIAALLEALTTQDVDAAPPALRSRFAQYCRYWAQIADPSKPPPPKSGILSKLRDGERAD